MSHKCQDGRRQQKSEEQLTLKRGRHPPSQPRQKRQWDVHYPCQHPHPGGPVTILQTYGCLMSHLSQKNCRTKWTWPILKLGSRTSGTGSRHPAWVTSLVSSRGGAQPDPPFPFVVTFPLTPTPLHTDRSPTPFLATSCCCSGGWL